MSRQRQKAGMVRQTQQRGHRPGAGEEMVDHAVVRLDKMLGRLHDAPSANWK